MNIGKYAFTSIEQAQTKIDSLGLAQDEEGNNYATHKHTVVKLGYEAIITDTVDEEGNPIQEVSYGTDYLVDVLWCDLEADENGEVDHPYGWKTYSIDISTEGIHGFMGLSYQSLKF